LPFPYHISAVCRVCLLPALLLSCRQGPDWRASDPCEGVTCSGAGTCAVLAGDPYCLCDAGTHPSYLACLENDPLSPCLGITCNDRGICLLASHDRPYCECDEGFSSPEQSDLICISFPCYECTVRGETRCSGQVVEQCGYDGSGCLVWQQQEDCAEGGGQCREMGGAASCCRPAVTEGTFSLPAHTVYVRWEFENGSMSGLRAEIEIQTDPGADVGLTFSPCSAAIDGSQFYFALQTDLHDPEAGSVGKGILFTRIGSADPADARPAAAGFAVSSPEANYVGVRLPFPWGAHIYAMQLQRAETDEGADWFDLTVTRVADGVETHAGGLRFPRRAPAIPASVAGSMTSFIEIYSNATDYGDVPRWIIAVAAEGDGRPAAQASCEYPAYPAAEFPNADCYYDQDLDLVFLRTGGDVERCHEPGLLFVRE
jgi:hypothetical protein